MINLDFADVKTVMKEKGLAHMGIGNASGEKRASEAARQAVESPLLETSINGARGVLMNITGGPDLSLLEVNEAAEIIAENADPEANIIFGADIDDAMGDSLRITVIATGFESDRAIPQVPPMGAQSGMYNSQPVFQSGFRAPMQPPMQPQQPPAYNNAAYYAPRRPMQHVMEEEPVAEPVPLREATFTEGDLPRNYAERPKNKLDVPAFLRNK